jgi:hypothetical protein
MTEDDYPRSVVEQLDGWANQLAAPLLPPTVTRDGDHVRLMFREHLPHTVMVGKAIRAVSGLRAALLLAEAGFITECGALLRIVFDFCTEINAVAEALNRGGEPPAEVKKFVNQYFIPRPRTPDELAAAEKTFYVAREELMKAEVRMAQDMKLDGEVIRKTHRFLNMSYDAYVHGAYETTMELCDAANRRFLMRGHPEQSVRTDFITATFITMHEVVGALRLTAAMTACSPVYEEAGEVLRTMITRPPWGPSSLKRP